MASPDYSGGSDMEFVEVTTPGEERHQRLRHDTAARRKELELQAELEALRRENAELKKREEARKSTANATPRIEADELGIAPSPTDLDVEFKERCNALASANSVKGGHLEDHLRDALNLKSFMEEAAQVDEWMQRQMSQLENNYNRTEFSLEEGGMDETRDFIARHNRLLASLADRCAHISPLWHRSERVPRPTKVVALCDYKSKHITVRHGYDSTLLDNNDLIQWRMREVDGVEARRPCFESRRRITTSASCSPGWSDSSGVPIRKRESPNSMAMYNSSLASVQNALRKLWERKHRLVRFNMVLNTMKTVRGWDLATSMSIAPEQRDEIIKALNADAHKLLAELDHDDPLSHRLKGELRLMNEHFYNLPNRIHKGPETAA